MKLIMILIIFLSVSCAGPSNLRLVDFDTKIINKPSINKVQTQELGNTLVEYISIAKADTIEITKEFVTEKNIAGVYFIIAPQILKPLAINNQGNTIYRAKNILVFGGLSANGPVPPEALKAVYSGQELCFPQFATNLTKLGEGTCLPDTYYKDAIYIDLSKPNITQQLIYNGRINDSVKFLYRELSEGKLMRAPFTQEIQYDLKKGNEIGFKGARLKILEASNREITYKVLKHFNY